MLDCKKALMKQTVILTKAVELLREKGLVSSS